MGKFVRRRHEQDKAVSLFLDSGAYSAWTQGVEINIRDYIDFIKQHQDIIDIYANLDVISIDGKRGSKLTAELTLKNQKIMEEGGSILFRSSTSVNPLNTWSTTLRDIIISV